MNSSKKKPIILGIIVAVILAVVLLYPKPEPPEFVAEYAETLALNYFGGCEISDSETEDPCTLTTDFRKEGKKIFVIATYSDLRDESVAAIQYEGEAHYNLGEWSVPDYSQKAKCQPGRGHQDFSDEPCQ